MEIRFTIAMVICKGLLLGSLDTPRVPPRVRVSEWAISSPVMFVSVVSKLLSEATLTAGNLNGMTAGMLHK